MASAKKKTLVIGASTNPERYSHKAVKRLLLHDHPVIALGRKSGEIEGVSIETEYQPFEGVDTVTVYLNEKNQEAVEDYILSLKPRRIVFNPGAENPRLAARAEAAGIDWENACTLVLLSTNAY